MSKKKYHRPASLNNTLYSSKRLQKYLVAIALTTILLLLISGTWTLAAAMTGFSGKGLGTAGATHASASPVVTGQSSINLFPRALEVIQAAQDRVNATSGPYVGVPLVAKKLTAVRLHPDVSGASGPVTDVTAEVRGFRDGIELPGSPLKPRIPKLVIDPGDDFFTRRNNTAKTFNFLLPISWTEAGKIELRATINLGNAISEIPGGEVDNSLSVTDLLFQAIPNLNIQAVGVEIRGMAPTTEQVFRTFDFLRMTYPVPSVSIINPGKRLVLPSSGLDCGFVLGALESSFAIADPNGRDLVYGVLPFDLDCVGLAWLPGRHAIGNGSMFDRGRVAAQEIGHNFGLVHAGNSHCEGDFEPWPYYHGGFGIIFEGRGPQGAGFVPRRMLALPSTAPFFDLPECSPDGDDICQVGPSGVRSGIDCTGLTDHAHDFMSYGDQPLWISALTFERLFNKFLTLPAMVSQPLGAPRNYLVVSGQIRTDGKLGMHPSYQIQAQTGTADDTGTGPFSIELQDSKGRSLFTRRFAIGRGEVDFVRGGRQALGFTQIVPFDQRPARIVIKEGGATISQTLASIVVSPNSPTVEVLSPNGGENWAASGEQVIRWIARDTDRDMLHYAVQYSKDGGQTWIPIAMNLTDTSLSVNSSTFSGSTQALIRVLATDGVNTGSDQSNGFFAVANKPPLVSILSPQSGGVFPDGMTLPLEGDGIDPEDDVLSENVFRWSSNIDGALGTGRQIDANNLSPGMHIITITATDSGGLSATASINVVIGSIPPPIITCPANIEIVSGSSSVVVTYPTPIVTGGAGGTIIVCSPPSGSSFPVGTTTVNCTATDVAGNSASCAFTVTVNVQTIFDICLENQVRSQSLRFNSTTGDYQFTKCGPGGFSLSGTGIVKRKGCTLTLTHYSNDRRVLATADACFDRGKASLQVFSLGTTLTITDRNLTDNTCSCP